MDRFDIPEPWQLTFQDPATAVSEGIIGLHNWILFYIIAISTFVLYGLLVIGKRYKKEKHPIAMRNLKEGTAIEVIWTVTPALVLITIAFPSFELLYLMDEVIDPAITIKAIGHQWYWEYEYTDLGEKARYESYMVPTEELKLGETRVLEVDNSVVLPVETGVRAIVTATDVLHSWAIPSLGVKVDSVPGRLNQTGIYIKRKGTYYGQCSELCGVQHGFMPIVIKAVGSGEYIAWTGNWRG